MANPNPNTKGLKPAWEPGQSGNPSGGSKLLEMRRRLKEMEEDYGDKPMEYLINLLSDSSVKADTKARVSMWLHEIWHGKAVQRIEGAGDEGEHLHEIKWTVVPPPKYENKE